MPAIYAVIDIYEVEAFICYECISDWQSTPLHLQSGPLSHSAKAT